MRQEHRPGDDARRPASPVQVEPSATKRASARFDSGTLTVPAGLPVARASNRVAGGVVPAHGQGNGRRRRRIGAVLAGVVLVSAGCTGDDESAEPAAPVTTTAAPGLRAPSQDPRAAAQEAAIAAYRGMWFAYAEAGETADPSLPALAQHADGEALRLLTRAVTAFRDQGQVTKGRPVLRPRVQKVTGSPPTEVRIDDCADTTNWLTYKKSGGLADDEPGGRRSIGATVRDVGGEVWKVTSFGALEVGTC